MCVFARALGWGEVSDRKGRSWVGADDHLQAFVKEDAYCYGLHVCAPPKFTRWNPDAQSDGVRKWDL